MPRVEEKQDVQPDSATRAKYLFTAIGTLPECGGCITKAADGLAIADLTVGRAGDALPYEDGGNAAIIDGADTCAADSGKPAVLAGSGISNGDHSVEIFQNFWMTGMPDCEAFDRERLTRRRA